MHARSGCNPITHYHYITKTQHKHTGGNWQQLATGWRVAASEAPGIIQAPKARTKEAIRAGGTARCVSRFDCALPVRLCVCTVHRHRHRAGGFCGLEVHLRRCCGAAAGCAPLAAGRSGSARGRWQEYRSTISCAS
jgi:hypothetical protein